jgi:predicted nucleotidyltransferase
MAKSLPKRVKKFIKNYIKILKSQIKIEKVILFGSYAYGKQHRDSDIDLIVLSPDFKKWIL